MSEREAVSQFEQRLRPQYEALFPSDAGWEKGAAHSLLAYDSFVAQSGDTETVDNLKYPLMHVLRWGANARSRPLGPALVGIDARLFEQCWAALKRANEYEGVFGAFRLFDAGVVGLHSISDRAIEFDANPKWMAYDLLDRLLAERLNPDRNLPEGMAAIGHLADTVLHSRSGLATYYPNMKEFREGLPHAPHLQESGFELPDSWSFDDIPIGVLRSFWTGLTLFAMLHMRVSSRLVGYREPHFYHLVVRQKDRLIGWLADCLDMDRALVARLIHLHTYGREHTWPDIALTPLLSVSPHLIAFTPRLVLSSRFERNFCSFVARNHKALYDASSNVFAPSMAARFVEAFQDAGLHAKASVPIQTSKGKTDIDLLVWSPKERCVLAAELMWVTPTADVVEVLRGHQKCIEKLTQQIPKYREALSDGAGVLVQRAFALGKAPTVDHWSCALVARGFVGPLSPVNDSCLFAPDQLALEQIRREHSLSAFCEFGKTAPYVPVHGRDFQLRKTSVTSPSGHQVTFWERSTVQ